MTTRRSDAEVRAMIYKERGSANWRWVIRQGRTPLAISPVGYNSQTTASAALTAAWSIIGRVSSWSEEEITTLVGKLDG